MKHYQPTCGDTKPLKLDSSPLKNDGFEDLWGETAFLQGQTATLPKTNSQPLKRGPSKLQPSICGEGCLFQGGLKKTWICIMFDAIPEKVPKTSWWLVQPISLYTLYTQLYLIPHNGTRQTTRGPVVLCFFQLQGTKSRDRKSQVTSCT